jgi:hypothetical protein
VPFVEVIAAQGIAVVVAMTTVVGIGKEHVFVLVVANPLAATVRSCQLACLSA